MIRDPAEQGYAKLLSAILTMLALALAVVALWSLTFGVNFLSEEALIPLLCAVLLAGIVTAIACVRREHLRANGWGVLIGTMLMTPVFFLTALGAFLEAVGA